MGMQTCSAGCHQFQLLGSKVKVTSQRNVTAWHTTVFR